MKRYLLFSWDDEDCGGWLDYKGSFETPAEAIAAADGDPQILFRNHEIVDRDQERVILDGYRAPKYSGGDGSIHWAAP